MGLVGGCDKHVEVGVLREDVEWEGRFEHGGSKQEMKRGEQGTKQGQLVPFASRLLFKILPTETKVESRTSQSKRGTSVNLSKSGDWSMVRSMYRTRVSVQC